MTEHKEHMTSKIELLRYEGHADMVCSHIPKDGNVLDVGCGFGHFDEMIRKRRPDVGIVGLDMLERSEWKSINGIKFIVGDALCMPFPDKSFDVVVSSGLIEHLDEDKFLAEVKRVLKDGSYNIVINMPNKYGMSENISHVLGIVKQVPGEIEMRYNIDSITHIFNRNGFHIISLKREGFIPAQFGLFGRRIEGAMNHIAGFLVCLDKCLNWCPLSQSFIVVSRRV